MICCDCGSICGNVRKLDPNGNLLFTMQTDFDPLQVRAGEAGFFYVMSRGFYASYSGSSGVWKYDDATQTKQWYTFGTVGSFINAIPTMRVSAADSTIYYMGLDKNIHMLDLAGNSAGIFSDPASGFSFPDSGGLAALAAAPGKAWVADVAFAAPSPPVAWQNGTRQFVGGGWTANTPSGLDHSLGLAAGTGGGVWDLHQNWTGTGAQIYKWSSGGAQLVNFNTHISTFSLYGADTICSDLFDNVYAILPTGPGILSVRSYTSTGTVRWTQSFPVNDQSVGCVSDPSGNIFAAAAHKVYKYSNAGTLLWTYDHGATITSIDADAQGNLYLGGASTCVQCLCPSDAYQATVSINTPAAQSDLCKCSPTGIPFTACLTPNTTCGSLDSSPANGIFFPFPGFFGPIVGFYSWRFTLDFARYGWVFLNVVNLANVQNDVAYQVLYQIRAKDWNCLGSNVMTNVVNSTQCPWPSTLNVNFIGTGTLACQFCDQMVCACNSVPAWELVWPDWNCGSINWRYDRPNPFFQGTWTQLNGACIAPCVSYKPTPSTTDSAGVIHDPVYYRTGAAVANGGTYNYPCIPGDCNNGANFFPGDVDSVGTYPARPFWCLKKVPDAGICNTCTWATPAGPVVGAVASEFTLTIQKGVAWLLVVKAGGSFRDDKCDALYVGAAPGDCSGGLTLNLVCNASTCDPPPNYPWPASVTLIPKGSANCL